MAEIYKLGGSIDMYNVSYGVGEGMFNKMDDVMMVQWLLKHHFQRSDKKPKLGKIWAIDIVNGVWSKQLDEISGDYPVSAVSVQAGGGSSIVSGNGGGPTP